MRDARTFESNASFAKDYIDAAVDALFNCDSKEAAVCLDHVERLISALRRNLGPVGA